MLDISIVTPSFNQGQYLEETILSVLNQDYSALEYVIIDGGSQDHSLEIIRNYGPRLAYWQSKKDGGQYDGLNQGFAQTTGEIMGWINSDDKYMPWTLQIVGEIFALFPQIEWLTSGRPTVWDRAGRLVSCRSVLGFNSTDFYRGEYCADVPWYSTGWIQQEATFWRRSLWERTGGKLDTRYSFAGDFELWARFFQHADLYTIYTPLAGFRMWGSQKSLVHRNEYIDEANLVLAAHKKHPYNRAESLWHKAVSYIPRSIARSLKMVNENQVCLYDTESEAWRLVTV